MVKFKVITSILVIGIVLIIAMLKGINGILLASGIAAIAGLGGFAASKFKKS